MPPCRLADRSHVHYDPDAPHDRFAYRHIAHPGDFWLENLQIEDFLVTVYQPDNFRPVSFISTLSLFICIRTDSVLLRRT